MDQVWVAVQDKGHHLGQKLYCRSKVITCSYQYIGHGAGGSRQDKPCTGRSRLSSHIPAQDTLGGSHTHQHLKDGGEYGLEGMLSQPLTPTPHRPPSLSPSRALTLALGASRAGLKACWANTLEAAFCVLTPSIGTGRGAAGTFIHIWGRGDQWG